MSFLCSTNVRCDEGGFMKRPAVMFISAVLLVSVGLVVGFLACSATAPSTTTLPVTTTTSVKAQPESAIWPFANTPLRFHDPVTAASSFAVTYLGMTSPIVGAYQAGDSQSGEVPIRSTALGPITTVMVRKFGTDQTWWAIGSAAPDILLTAPTALDGISSPVTLRGRSTAFEGFVNVEIREDQSLQALSTGNFIGGSMGVVAPFLSRQSFPNPGTDHGSILLRTFSARDGHVMEAGAVRIRFTSP